MAAPTSAEVSWDAVAGAIGYELQGRQVGGAFRDVNISGTSRTFNIFKAGRSYEWQVRANCGASGVSAYTALQGFTMPSSRTLAGGGFSMLPNPAQYRVVMDLYFAEGEVDIQILDLTGRVVHEHPRCRWYGTCRTGPQWSGQRQLLCPRHTARPKRHEPFGGSPLNRLSFLQHLSQPVPSGAGCFLVSSPHEVREVHARLSSIDEAYEQPQYTFCLWSRPCGWSQTPSGRSGTGHQQRANARPSIAHRSTLGQPGRTQPGGSPDRSRLLRAKGGQYLHLPHSAISRARQARG